MSTDPITVYGVGNPFKANEIRCGHYKHRLARFRKPLYSVTEINILLTPFVLAALTFALYA